MTEGRGAHRHDLILIAVYDARSYIDVLNHTSFTGIDATARFERRAKATGTFGAVPEFGPEVIW
jgi:hypothetical protein